jgi:hypothetical protein
MSDANNAENKSNAASEQPQGIPPQHNNTSAPSEREIAERDNQRVAENRERFILGPFRRFVYRPIRQSVDALDHHGGAITAAATASIAVLTYFLASYAYEQGISFDKQLRVMQSQLDEMKSGSEQTNKLIAANERLANATAAMGATTERFAAAAEKSAQAATDSVAIAQQNLGITGSTAGRQLRAYISIPQAEITDYESSTAILVRIQVKNTGGAAAKGTMRAALNIFRDSEDVPTIPRKTLEAQLTVNPNSDA